MLKLAYWAVVVLLSLVARLCRWGWPQGPGAAYEIFRDACGDAGVYRLKADSFAGPDVDRPF